MDSAKPNSADAATIEPHVNPLALKRAALVIRALNHPLRQRLLKTIHRKGKACVSDLQKDLDLEQSVTSLHLTELRKAGLLRVERTGRSRWYSVNAFRLQEVQQLIKDLLITACFLLPLAL